VIFSAWWMTFFPSIVTPVHQVSFSLQTHQTLGIIGESGCGKSVTAQALMRLLPPRTSRVDGEITLGGEQLDQLYVGRDVNAVVAISR
jgi:ABC-type glutathione transport system ATPase component